MQPCTRIYYSNVYQLLNMFRAELRSHLALTAAGTHRRMYKREAAIAVFELLMMSGVLLETC